MECADFFVFCENSPLPRRSTGSRWTPTPPPPLAREGAPAPAGHRLRRLAGAPPGWGPANPMPALGHNPPPPGGNPCSRKRAHTCLAHAPGGRRGPVPRALVNGWCAALAVVPLRSPSPGAVWRNPATCEPLAVRTPACGFEWRAVPLAGWLSGFEPSHIGCRGAPRGAGWAVSRHCPALLAALCVVVSALQEWCSWEEVPPFRSPPARRETHTATLPGEYR